MSNPNHVVKKPATRTVMPGTILPDIKEISITPAYEIIATVEFYESFSEKQRTTLETMLANHKKQVGFSIAMSIDGRWVRFRRFGNKTMLGEQALRHMLDSMGIGEISTPPKSQKKHSLPPKVITRAPMNNARHHHSARATRVPVATM